MPIKATFVDYDRIPTRKAFKLVLEVPEEMQAKVFEDLGYPISGADIWVAVARLSDEVIHRGNDGMGE